MKVKLLAVILWLSTAATVVLRIYQYANGMEKTTGFFLNSNSQLLLFGVFVAFSLVCIILSWGHRSTANPTAGYSPLVGVFSLAAASGYAYSLIDQLVVSKAYLNATTWNFVLLALELLSCIFFLYFAIICFRRQYHRYASGGFMILSLVPAIYFCVELCENFMNYTMEISVSDHMIQIVYSAAMMLFFLYSGAYLTHLNNLKVKKYSLLFGYIASFISLVSVIPRYILIIQGIADQYLFLSTPNPMDSLVCLFVICFTMHLTFSRSNRIDLEGEGIYHSKNIDDSPRGVINLKDFENQGDFNLNIEDLEFIEQDVGQDDDGE